MTTKKISTTMLAVAGIVVFIQHVFLIQQAYQISEYQQTIGVLQAELEWWKCEPKFQQPEQASIEPTGDHPDIEDEIEQAMQAAPFTTYGSPVQDLRKEYASAYRTAHHKALKRSPRCEACGITAEELADGDHLDTHHKISVKRIFEEGLDHSLISDPDNLIVLCRQRGKGCHWIFGHYGKSWADSNPNVVRDAAKNLKHVRANAKTTQAI